MFAIPSDIFAPYLTNWISQRQGFALYALNFENKFDTNQNLDKMNEPGHTSGIGFENALRIFEAFSFLPSRRMWPF
jgi:hypothetical protein